MKNSALVVIDLQNDITKNYKEIITKVNEAIDWGNGKDVSELTVNIPESGTYSIYVEAHHAKGTVYIRG